MILGSELDAPRLHVGNQSDEGGGASVPLMLSLLGFLLDFISLKSFQFWC